MDTKDSTSKERAGATLNANVPVATIKEIRDAIDKKGGVLTKAHALKYLSSILLGDITANIADRQDSANAGTVVTVRLHNSTIDQMYWLAGEVQELSKDLAGMIDDLQSDYVEVADAAYYAEHPEARRS